MAPVEVCKGMPHVKRSREEFEKRYQTAEARARRSESEVTAQGDGRAQAATAPRRAWPR